MHGTIAAALRDRLGADGAVETATLDDPEHGLSEERLAETDVLFWWGHMRHDYVEDAVVERVHRHVLAGMGLVVLRSAHFSKIFIRLMGTDLQSAAGGAGDRSRGHLDGGTDASDRRGRPAAARACPHRRCTASTSTCRCPTTWCSSPASPAARCSARE